MRRTIPGVAALILIFAAWLTTTPWGTPLSKQVVGSFSSPSSFFSTWKTKKWAGDVSIDFHRTGNRPYISLASKNSSWAFVRSVSVDLSRTPCLTWYWKADALPARGNGRIRATDDEAAQVYVIFPAKKFLGLVGGWKVRILGYTWETDARPGSIYTSPKNGNTKIFVLRNRHDGTGRWRLEHRNLIEDFQRAFGAKAPNPMAVSIQIDSDDTKSSAASAFSELGFGTGRTPGCDSR